MNHTKKPKSIKLTITNKTLEKYNSYYFHLHPKAKKAPIKNPYHESINQWMILKRPLMNAVKQKWKDFVKWFVDEQGYSNLHIDRCEITQTVYYPNNRRHDTDNSVPKFILDGLVEGGMIIDDDMLHITKLTLKCGIDLKKPRTELYIRILQK